jgi:hypothetical protein
MIRTLIGTATSTSSTCGIYSRRTLHGPPILAHASPRPCLLLLMMRVLIMLNRMVFGGKAPNFEFFDDSSNAVPALQPRVEDDETPGTPPINVGSDQDEGSPPAFNVDEDEDEGLSPVGFDDELPAASDLVSLRSRSLYISCVHAS